MTNTKEIYLAGGCFWGVEKYLQSIPGVLKTEVGYANGKTENPTYEEVCNKGTGHAETVKVSYDKDQISLKGLLMLFFKAIDPTSLNKQGNDVGVQYRTGIYYKDKEDEVIINEALSQLQNNYKKPVVVEVKELENYTRAEEYHQKYLDRIPNGYCHLNPRLFEKAKKSYVDPNFYNAQSKEELFKKLNIIQYDVTMNNRTERPYDNEFWDCFEEGIYVDVTTGEPLFLSTDKFESCGWPSFSKPIDPDVIKKEIDFSHGMIREEVRSRVGNAHLGHVFNDGKKEKGGLRYCINSAALRFIPKDEMEKEGYSKFLPLLEI